MKIHALIHAPFEKLGAIETWAMAHDYPISETHTYRGESLPSLEEIDLLLIMGGPQSAKELETYAYLADEISFIQHAIKQDKKILGICLGAQLIAEALGEPTQKSPHKEIGMHPIEILEAGSNDPIFKQFPHTFEVMHWHSDMPSIPEKAVLLAKSQGCPHQAFRYGDNVYALQFHLEFTRTLAAEMMIHCAEDLTVGEYIQSKETVLNTDFETNNEQLFVLLNHLAITEKVKASAEELFPEMS